ncbi:uncharacterized protein zgc:193726 isoform X6 [Pimephales promelas]|uniref:uncharacterized protein zgc:193726 isoform X6 n=1 Tax=Pimephales promelas TaxID=90988 RepID=UPI001955854A|nr:uncharacterized protein zgc:193726 isoform X6 [Pimephales promelas]
MNSMFSVWTLSSLILTYTLAFPIFNNTSVSHMEISPNTVRNSTEYMKTNHTNKSETGIPKRKKFLRMCFLSTCAMWNLGSMLQHGNEIAGDMATDPMGIGKK